MLSLYFAFSNTHIFFWKQWPTYQHLTNSRSATLNSIPSILWDTEFRESIKRRHSICLLLHVDTPFITFWHWRTFISSLSLHVPRSVYAVFWWCIHLWRFTCQFITHGPSLAVLMSSSVKIISLTKKNGDLSLFTVHNCNLIS